MVCMGLVSIRAGYWLFVPVYVKVLLCLLIVWSRTGGRWLETWWSLVKVGGYSVVNI